MDVAERMGTPTPHEDTEAKDLAIWKRRGAIFLFLGVIAIIFGATAGEEVGNNPLFAVDDLVVLVVAILLIAIWVVRLRGASTLPQLRTAANISVILLAVAVLAKLYGVFVERNSPDDFGDEIPSLYILLVSIGSRFF